MAKRTYRGDIFTKQESEKAKDGLSMYVGYTENNRMEHALWINAWIVRMGIKPMKLKEEERIRLYKEKYER
jgi:hypothetical protein